MSRERFEELFPRPYDVFWDSEIGEFCAAVFVVQGHAWRHQHRYEGYQSRQPEIDELVEALEAYRTAMAMPTWSSDHDWTPPERTYFESYGGGDCSKHGRYYGHCHCCADDARKAHDRANKKAEQEREDALRDAEEKARALIAKHKGE